MLILNNDLAVYDCRAALKPGCRLRYAEVALSPIESVAGISACFAALDDQESAVAVVLDFMYPACARRRMIDCGCELRLNELQSAIKMSPPQN